MTLIPEDKCASCVSPDLLLPVPLTAATLSFKLHVAFQIPVNAYKVTLKITKQTELNMGLIFDFCNIRRVSNADHIMVLAGNAHLRDTEIFSIIKFDSYIKAYISI